MATKSENTKPIVLIVDDVPQNIQLLGQVLRNNGYEVIVSLSGKQAFQTIEFAKPDIILLDIQMPEMDGFEVCTRLKANAETEDIPIIFLTAHTDTDNIVRAFSLGAADYVTKPFKNEELLSRVNTHLSLKESQILLAEKNEELSLVNERLEERVKERTEQLAEALDKEKQFNSMKSKFVLLIAHEFRTPLTAITSSAGLLALSIQRNKPLAEEKLTRVTEQIQRGTKDITGILDSVNMMMDTEMQILRGETTKVDIVDVCANTVTGYRDGHGVAQVIEVHVPDTQCMYETEPRLIITAIKQLLNNAVRYSPQDSPILFTLTCSETDFTISVQDFGKGVDEDEKGYIFEMFRRGKKEEEVGANRGLGIGLGIVKMCVDALKGTAECESVVGEGSTFTLRIPFC